MKKITLSITMLLCTIGGSLIAQNGVIFEYKVSSSQGNSGTIKTYYSNSGSRVEIQTNNSNTTGIVKNSSPTMINLLDDKNKTYISTELQQTADISNNSTSNVSVAVNKEKFGNYNCSHAIISKNGESRVYWTTTEIQDYEQYSKPNGINKTIGISTDYELLKANGAAGFIVKMLSTDAKGVPQTMELVKTEKKELNANLFAIPSDYKATAITSPTK